MKSQGNFDLHVLDDVEHFFKGFLAILETSVENFVLLCTPFLIGLFGLLASDFLNSKL